MRGAVFPSHFPSPLAPYGSPNSVEAEMMGERRLQDAPQNVAREVTRPRPLSPGGTGRIRS